jgi:quercetin dioxygenase-like cupin family protein
VVVEGTFAMVLGEPPKRYELHPGAIVVVEPNTPVKVANDSDEQGLIFIYGAPADASAEILDDSGS